MDSADNSALQDFFATLASPEVLAEVIAIVIASLIAVLGTHAVRNWHKRHSPPGSDATPVAKLIEGQRAVIGHLPFYLPVQNRFPLFA